MSSLNSLKAENIPSSWRLLPVGKVLLDTQYGTNEPAIEGGNTKVVGMKDIQDGKVLTADLTSSNLLDAERERYLLNRGDLLINRTNSYDLVGKVGIFASDDEIAFASYLVRLTVDRAQANPEYLNFCLNGYVAQTVIKRIATRAISQANVNPTEFKKHCYVPLPPVPEQTAIASLLSTLDLVIEKTERQAAAKEKRYSWLIKSLISEQCKHWEHLRADRIFKSISEKGNGGAELLSVTQDRGVIPRTMLEGRVMSPESGTDSYKLIKIGDFAISLRSFQGGIEYSLYQGLISPAYTVLRPKVELHDEFYRHFFKSYIFIGKYLSIAVIGIRDGKQISIPDFMTVKIPLPPIDQQKQIAAVLNTARQEIDLLKKQAEAFRRQKRGLMQKLLTGEWRVRVGGDENGQATD